MNYATEATLPEGVLLGTKYLHRQIKERTQFLVLADDEDSAKLIIARALGESAAQKSFTFDVDDLHRWFRATDILRNGSPYQEAIDTVALTQRRLGSIVITGAAFTFVEKAMRSFWIESTEDQRARILTGDRQGNNTTFHPLPKDWEFDVPLIAQAIIAQY